MVAVQLARPRLDAELELGVRGLEVLLRALARQCAVDVVGDEGEQFLVARSETDLRRVALHHDPADHRVVALERHAQPAVRQRTETAHGAGSLQVGNGGAVGQQRLAGGRSEEHTSELQSLMRISYAVFCLKKK